MLSPGSAKPQVFLNACLLEGDSELEKRTRRGKRRAIIVSILLQLLLVAALVLVPLLTKGEILTDRVIFDPHVPYSPVGHPHQPAAPHPTPHTAIARGFYQHPRIPTGIDTPPSAPPPITEPEPEGEFIPDAPRTPGVPGGAQNVDALRDTTVIETHTPAQIVRRHVSEGVQAAMLCHRVQPTYPILAVQLHREGRVELHAIISTDGSIQSLEVLSGDPFFLASATAAVREWRYRPTILNGQPVEVDTHITVIYTLSH